MTDKQEQPNEPPPAEPDAPSLQAELDELMDRLRRVTADYQNYQKRTARELADVRKFANADLIKELLAVVDDLERATAAGEKADTPDAKALLDGVRITYEHLLALLGRHGVTAIDALGQPFDPERHEAMMRQPTADAEPMTVTAELVKGYLMHGRTLRPTRVAVAVRPEEDEDETSA